MRTIRKNYKTDKEYKIIIGHFIKGSTNNNRPEKIVLLKEGMAKFMLSLTSRNCKQISILKINMTKVIVDLSVICYFYEVKERLT